MSTTEQVIRTDLAVASDLFATPQRFLWHAATRTAILADLHLGIEQAWQRQGLAIPGMLPTYVPALTRAWAKLIERKPTRVIIGGDLFDSAGPSDVAIDLSRRMFRALPGACRIVITHGNHDPDPEALAGIFAEMRVSVCEHFRVGQHLVSHGHQIPADARSLPSNSAFWIVGHQHPAVMMQSHVQAVKMACFAICGGKRRTVILPAFSRGPLGSDLLTASHWLLPTPRSENAHIRVAGLIEPSDSREPQVLDFGALALLG